MNKQWTLLVAAAVAMGLCLSAFAAEEGAKFIGSGKCKMCHIAVHKSWEATKHAKAMDVLKAGEAKEAKEKAKLDPAKDYTKDESCLACHTTGAGKPGGYNAKADEKDMEKMAKDLGSVGCEACHGAGEKYSDVHKKIKQDKSEYTDEEMVKAGTVKPTEKECKTCHNEKSPTAKEFKFEEASKTGLHEKPGLKQKKK